jgi:hypothetical protein
MITKEYERSIKAHTSDSSYSISKDGITVALEPFDINEYFRDSIFSKSIQTLWGGYNNSFPFFPLVVNYFHGMSVFKVTIQNNSNTYVAVHRDAPRYGGSKPLVEELTQQLLINSLPCYSMSKRLIERRTYGFDDTTDDENCANSFIRSAIDKVNSDIDILCRQRVAWMYDPSILSGQTAKGYIIFPQVDKESDVEFTIANTSANTTSFKFRVKPTLQYYKSSYNEQAGRYLPYEIITKEQYEAEEAAMDTITKKNIRNRKVTYGGIGIATVLAIVGALFGVI